MSGPSQSRFCIFLFFIANNAWLFSVIRGTISLSSQGWDGEKKGDLLAFFKKIVSGYLKEECEEANNN